MPLPPLYEASPFGVLSLVQKCTSISSLKKARQLHALILATTTVSLRMPFVHNNILSMYARSGSLKDSQLVFDKMPQRNIVSFNALITAYSRVPDHAISAIKLYTQMESGCQSPNSLTFTSLLQASSLLEDLLAGSSLHAQAVKFGFLDEICVQTSLLGMYSNCGNLGSAEKVFVDISDKDVVAWNSLILGNLKNGNIRAGLQVFVDMVRVGVVPTEFTYSMILNACSRLNDNQLGQLIHAQIIVTNMLADLPLQNVLLDMYCSSGDTQTASRIFSGMESTDLVSWNSMISGYSENEEVENAMNLFVQLLGQCSPKPDEYTYAALICATNSFPASDYGKPLHAQVMKTGHEGSVFVGSTLVCMYFKNGETEAAQKVFCSISHKDIVLWTEMIAGYSRMADPRRAISFYSEMCHKGYEVDSYALSGALNACADLAIMKQGEMIHSQAVKMGNVVEMSVCGSLIDMYVKSGSLEAADAIFSQVSDPDLKCWNSMLGGYNHHGMGAEAVKIFDRILEHSLSPDQVTFLNLLSACSHARLIEQGKFFWNYMKEIGFSPGPKHYSCMVSLLSRAGLLEEAEKLIIESPYLGDNLELWRSLLSSCVINRNLQVGIHAAEEVLKLDSEDGTTLILLSNLYASAGRREKVAEIRKRMRVLMLERDPGVSWIEAKSDIHVFSSGDQSHHKVDEIQTELHRLQENMIRRETDEKHVQ